MYLPYPSIFPATQFPTYIDPSGKFILPYPLNNKNFSLNNLEYEEREEIIKILRRLSAQLRPYTPLLSQYQDFLTDIDVIAAKAKYAKNIQGVLPKINTSEFNDLLELIDFPLKNLDYFIKFFDYETIQLVNPLLNPVEFFISLNHQIKFLYTLSLFLCHSSTG